MARNKACNGGAKQLEEEEEVKEEEEEEEEGLRAGPGRLECQSSFDDYENMRRQKLGGGGIQEELDRSREKAKKMKENEKWPPRENHWRWKK